MTAQSPVHTLSRSNSTPTEGLGVVDDIYRNAVDISNGDFASVQAMIDNARSGMMCLAADPVDFFGRRCQWVVAMSSLNASVGVR